MYYSIANIFDEFKKSDSIFNNFRSFDIALALSNKQPISDFVLSGDGSKYTLELKVPGYSKDDITVELVNDELFITGKSEKYGNFKKEYYSIDSDEIDATVENGILTISIPTNKKKQKKQLIKIK